MLAKFFYQWNPLNLCGVKVGLEDLIYQPLLSNETLMQDSCGHCRRIKVPSTEASLLERVIFWLQVHINEKDHLETIDKLISLFYEKLLLHPPEETEELQRLNSEIENLRSLKNDYNFVYLKKGDPAFIELRLSEIEQHAYSIFSYFYKQHVTIEEDERKRAFLSFQEKADKIFQILKDEYYLGLVKARFIMIAPLDILRYLLPERIQSLDVRFQTIQELCEQIKSMEARYNGTFTIPHLNECVNQMRFCIDKELHKIELELQVLIRCLQIRYHLMPCHPIKKILDCMEIHLKGREERQSMTSALFQEALAIEIHRIKSILKNDLFSDHNLA